MQSSMITIRALSRLMKNKFSTFLEPSALQRANPHFISVVCGFPKDLRAKYKVGKFGDDAWFTSTNKVADVIGVADGVGGWRNYGIDAGEFSNFLMRTCERLVQSTNFNPHHPVDLLAGSYYELLEHKKPILGSSTACVLILNRETSTVYTANIGDSGFMVIRKGEIVHKSDEQQHYFNTPFQLSLPPPGNANRVLSDSPDAADRNSFPVEDGDVILVATDGVFDNVPKNLLLETLKGVQGEKDAVKLQMTANSIALMARSLSFDSEFMSPFAINARKNNINTIGGKPDDITVVLATVAL
jgi:protein phosphatase PTC7